MDDQLAQMLLSQLAGGGAQAGAPSLVDVVQQSMGDDPMAAQIVAALRQREAAAAQNGEGDDEPERLSDSEVADLLERLYAELEALRERTRTIADALGACPRCFGDDELCAVCRGRGTPGGRRPDAALFTELVGPAWRRIGGLGDDDLLLMTEAEGPTP